MPKQAKEKAKGGRPSGYSTTLANDICERIAASPYGLDYICNSDEALPHRVTVHRWLNEHEEFRNNYARAREAQADMKFDQSWEIAANSTAETYQVDRLKIDTIKWQASKLLPKKYGDKLTTEHTGPDGKELHLAGHEAAAKVAAILAVIKARVDDEG